MISNPSLAVDLELAPLLTSTPALELSLDRLAAARAVTVEMFRGLAPSPADPEVFVLSGPDAQKVELRVYRPPGDEIKPAIYYIHGGGFVLGTAAMRDGLNWQLAYDSQAVVLAVDYRLAPETPFPGPLNDCYCGLVWICANAASLNVDNKRIAVMGESGGGGWRQRSP